MQETQKNS